MTQKLPPNNYDAECGLLGCMLQSWAEAVPEVKGLEFEAFYDRRNREVFKIAMRLHSAGKMVDSASVFMESKKGRNDFGGIEYIQKLENSTPSALNLPYFLGEVTESYLRRRIIQQCARLSDQAESEGAIEALMANVQKFAAIEKPGEKEIVGARAASERLSQDLERRFNLAGALSGLDTGFGYLNYKTDGIQFGEQTLIGARPSFGKTAFGLNIFHRTAFVHKIPALFVTIEMSVEALMRRLLSMSSEMGMGEIRKGSYSPEAFKSFGKFHSASATSPIHFLDAVGGISIDDLCLQVRRYVPKHGIRLVVVDYLQKIKGNQNEEKKTYEIGDVSSKLKALWTKTGVAGLTLAQLNRESEREKPRMPRLSDLGDSKQIEQDADTVILIHRDRSKKQGEAQLVIAKQRDGELGAVDVVFNGTHCRFENPPPKEDDES